MWPYVLERLVRQHHLARHGIDAGGAQLTVTQAMTVASHSSNNTWLSGDRSARQPPLLSAGRPKTQQPLTRPPHLFDGARCERLADFSLRMTSKPCQRLHVSGEAAESCRCSAMQPSLPPPLPLAAARRFPPLAVLAHSPSLVLLLLRFPFPARLHLFATWGRGRHPGMRLRARRCTWRRAGRLAAAAEADPSLMHFAAPHSRQSATSSFLPPPLACKTTPCLERCICSY